jgi:DNA-binding transcriptional LysR family regulator
MAVELAQWRLFLAAADCGSLLGAAEVLHTDQPALSRSLRRLEAVVGAPLFVRSSRGLTLTELGRRLHKPVRELVDHAQAVETLSRAEARQVSGVLKIGAVDIYPFTTAIADACRELTVVGQPITTEVISLPWLAHLRAVADRTIDVGFTLTVDGRIPHAKGLRSRALWTETEIFALISARHPLADADRIDPHDLAELPLHLPAKADNPHVYNLTLELLADAGVPAPRRAPPLATFASVIANIAAGGGWMVSAGTLAQHTPPGLSAKPLTVALRRSVRAELIWHVHTEPATITAYADRFQSALASQLNLKHRHPYPSALISESASSRR